MYKIFSQLLEQMQSFYYPHITSCITGINPLSTSLIRLQRLINYN